MITIDKTSRLFSLHTLNTSYQMKADGFGFLLHLYYGPRIHDEDFSYLVQPRDRGFSGNPTDFGGDRRISADTLPLEYPCKGIGDYRESCIEVINPDGSAAIDLRYESHQLVDGKPGLSGLPAFYASQDDAQTLLIILRDNISGLRVLLQYSVFETLDIITRSAQIFNDCGGTVKLTRALSCCLDFMQPHNREIITFYGRHAGERSFQRSLISHGKFRIDSSRGASSLHYNPFAILCDAGASETGGNCWGMLFVYSGNFIAQAELDQANQLRAVTGVNPDGFCWHLEPGESFQTPETALCFSDSGFGELSRRLHRAIGKNLIRGSYKNSRPPVLINNWEATYFDFDDKKLIEIARQACELGVELFVLDDGWFGHRNDDTTSLGDWFVNKNKITCGLAGLSAAIRSMGLKFGIWVEPEMVSFDSRLQREHPDWVLAIPGRPPVISRCQYVLDMSRTDVVEHLYNLISDVIEEGKVDYIKWDMNRNISDVWSNALPPERQGEVLHRYILGVYSLFERLTARFPNVLFESCSGGGGRFDAGMLFYTPQIWCSDNTDPIERLSIQHGTSFAYPCSSVGAHVSFSPNHQTGRSTPLHTRGVVAMAGTFGYELNPSDLSEADKAEIALQISVYKQNWKLFSRGDYYRLPCDSQRTDYSAWMQVSSDKQSAVVSLVMRSTTANEPVIYLRLNGLDADAVYYIEPVGIELSGRALMAAGLPIPEMRGDYPAIQLFLDASKGGSQQR